MSEMYYGMDALILGINRWRDLRRERDFDLKVASDGDMIHARPWGVCVHCQLG